MEQRPLRLGDILDDYCPRERRVTNHAIVAMIEEDVKQTRCTTCDAEHVYKGGKAPRRKKADSTGALYKEVLAGIEEPTPRHVQTLSSMESDAMTAHDDDAPGDSHEPDEIDDLAVDHDEDDSQIHMLPPDEGPVHRPLIRAQLPRTEGMKVERQAPEFTIRQNNGRGPGGGFRGRGNGSAGHGSNGGGQRFGRGGPERGNGGGGRGQGGGFGRGPGGGRPGAGGGNQQRHGGPRKRSR